MDVRRLLPIGSVVMLKGGEKRLMIFGVKQKKADTNELYDYISVIYPEGNIGTQGQLLFNHEDIEQIFLRGYEDEERAGFIDKLALYYEKRQ